VRLRGSRHGCGNADSGDIASTDAASGDNASEVSGSTTIGDAPETIRIGFVAPFTGPMANFTVGIYHAADLALAAMNKDGGMYIKEYDKKIPVEIIWGDTGSNTTKASEVATKLATDTKVHILVAEWTPATINRFQL
jgi:branched-chain amino acid transport system substrate-binding protein